jgi:DNA-directed RNA polymerase specialized sigma24 family protein
VELKVFGGLTTAETAAVIGVSKRTVDDDWAVAKMWLRRRLKKDGERDRG